MSSTTPSTYSRLLGENPFADWFLEHLKISRKEFGRFRDAALYREDVGTKEKGTYVIRILTRNAGSKAQFQPINDKLAAHRLFIRQELEPTDGNGTYLYFFFAMPESMIQELAGVVDLDEAYKSGDKWLIDNRSLKTKYMDAVADLEK